MTNMATLNRRADDPEFDSSMADSRQLVRRRPELAKADGEQVVALWNEHKLRSAGVGAELRTQQYYYPFDVQGIDGHSLADELVAAREPFSDRAEEFRSLRRALLARVFSDAVKRAVAVVSAEEGVGKTYMVANLAISFSQFTGRTLLIDANLRQPRLHRLFGTTVAAGLGNLLAGEVKSEGVLPVEVLKGLHFLAAGDTDDDPVRLLHGPRFSMFLEQMADSFDYVFLDTPSNQCGPDARLIAARAGAALLVGREGQSRVARLQQLVSQLHRGPALLAGVVLNLQ
jgi:protein-tyrosine kinase